VVGTNRSLGVGEEQQHMEPEPEPELEPELLAQEEVG
jgi:hypothetical protein